MTILQGTSGNDDLRIAADDTGVSGNGGTDTVDLQDSPVAVNVNLNDGTLTASGWLSGTVTLSGVTNIYGSWNGGTLTGGGNTTYIAAPGGNTTVNGGPQGTVITLGAGNDTVHGGAGNDEIYAGTGNNTIDGGGGYNGVSYITDPGAVAVDLYAGAWHNNGASQDSLANIVNIQGGNFGNILLGDYQDNIIAGGTGNDYIDGRQGNDTLTGAGGSDTFIMESGVGHDVITDFDTAHDVIDVSAFFSSFAAVQAAASQQGANTVIRLGASGQLTLNNISMGALTAGDFSFTAIPVPTGGGSTTGSAANSYTFTLQGLSRQYTVGAGGSTVSGGPEGANDTLTNMHKLQFVDGYLDYAATDPAGQVYRLYEATLGRAPDQDGLDYWTSALSAGTSLQSAANGFVGSAEFQSTYGSLNNSDFVTLLYHNVLHRDPDSGGLSMWVGLLNSGQDSRAQVVTGFSESAEDISNSTAVVGQGLWVGNAQAAEVARLYDSVFGRLPDASGEIYWTHALESGTSLQGAAAGFVNSAEFQSTYGGLNNSDFVTLIYHNVLHRPPDAGGLSYWVNDLNGGDSRAQVVAGFSESQEHVTNTAAHIDGGIWVTA